MSQINHITGFGGPLVPNDRRYLLRYRDDIPYFGPKGTQSKIPIPLNITYNVSLPVVVIADPLGNGQQTACVRWFGEVLGDKNKTRLMDNFQYLFPIHIDPFDGRFFPVDGEQRIENCQVGSIDNKNYTGCGPNDVIQLVCYERKPLCVVHANLVFLAYSWFGEIQPRWYADPARGDSSVQRIIVTAK